MGTEITTTNKAQDLAQWSKPSLPKNLDLLVSSNDSLAQMPVVGPKTAAILQAFCDHPEPPAVDQNWLLNQLGTLALKPMRKLADVEASAVIQRDLKLLSGYPQADLGYAIGRLTRESKFYPEISEFIKMVEYPANMRAAKKHQAWKLLHKHKTDWREPIPESELVTPEAIAQIKAEVDAEFPTNREEETK